jgi:hypothetical protein
MTKRTDTIAAAAAAVNSFLKLMAITSFLSTIKRILVLSFPSYQKIVSIAIREKFIILLHISKFRDDAA